MILFEASKYCKAANRATGLFFSILKIELLEFGPIQYRDGLCDFTLCGSAPAVKWPLLILGAALAYAFSCARIITPTIG